MDQFKPSSNLISFPLLITFITILAVAALGFFVLWPKYQELKVVELNIDNQEIELKTKKEYLQMLEELKLELEKNAAELAKVDSALPTDPSVPSLFNYLQVAASQAGLILTEISPFSVADSSALAGLKEIGFNVKISGTYPSVKSFISTLERSARMIEVESISLSSSEEGSFNFDLGLKTFSL
jgi:Tfp pilus assembly protein PilO